MERSIASIDVGTTKVCTLVGEVNELGVLRIVGVGVSPSRGLRKGVVVNANEAADAIVASVERAERISGYQVTRAYVGIAGPHVASRNSRGLVAIPRGDQGITDEDVARALDAPPPTLVHIPTDLLGRVAPKRAEWCVENFHYNNLFDNAAARQDLGFEYTIPFVEGARRVIAWKEAHGGFESSDDHSYYDAILSAWERCGAEMAQTLVDVD